MKTMNYRIAIVYPSAPAMRFDWDYYLANHLPLAVGTSMRHSDITHCDCDKPVDPARSPVACICVVHFANRVALERFCAFFANSHRESGAILADEPNYTAITPRFIACATTASSRPTATRAYRVRILLPARESFVPDAVETLRDTVATELGRLAAGTAIESDLGLGAIPLDAAPAFPLIWTATFADQNAANTFAALLSHRAAGALWRAAQCSDPAQALVTTSEVVDFDLARAASVRDRRS